MWWCEECEEAMEYEDAKIEREYYEAWGHEFSTEDLVCPHCGTSLVEYRGQDIEEDMTEEEALEILCAYGVPQDEKKFKEALDIAINVLAEKIGADNE